MAGLSSFLALVVGATLWWALREDPYVAPPPDAGSASAGPVEAAAVLQELAGAIEARDAAGAARLAAVDDDRVAARLAALVDNAEEISLDHVTLRYVDELAGVGRGDEWSASVTASWRILGVDEPVTSVDVRFDFAVDDDRVVVAGVGGEGGRTPVWMSGPLEVHRSAEVLVLAAADLGRYARLARRAVVVVRRVLPGWDGPLVVEVPRRAADVDAALGVARRTFQGVAGVTAAADGDDRGGGPVHVFLNPAQMESLRPLGQQVVVSHEATHVAVDAPGSGVPVWLLEGFADYVALRDVELPLSTTASQVLGQVRRRGLPRALPDEADFDQESRYFGAAYEASWLACRLLAEERGEQVLTRLYSRARGGQDFPRLFRRTTGRSLQAFTTDWRRLLRDLSA